MVNNKNLATLSFRTAGRTAVMTERSLKEVSQHLKSDAQKVAYVYRSFSPDGRPDDITDGLQCDQVFMARGHKLADYLQFLPNKPSGHQWHRAVDVEVLACEIKEF